MWYGSGGEIERFGTRRRPVRNNEGVSPRPTATRHDALAVTYLNAAAQLIDASMSDEPEARPPRLQAIHYPAALEWIRIEDVLRLVQASGRSASKRSMLNRWPTKDAFIRDAVIHAMLYRDDPAGDPIQYISMLEIIDEAKSFSGGVSAVVDQLLSILIGHPRSFLLAHIAPLLPHHPGLADDIRHGSEAAQAAWSERYGALLTAKKLRFRPEWSLERLTLAIQLVLDGVMVRSRIEPDKLASAAWATANLYSDTVLSIISGALDLEQDGLTLRDWLDGRVDRPRT